MELIDQIERQRDPTALIFVFDEIHDDGTYTMLTLPDSPDWPYSPFTAGKYDPDGTNEHPGERTTLQAPGKVMLTRVFTRLGY